MGKLGKVAAALGAAMAGGAAWFYAREKATEQPSYDLVESDGAFSIRRYPRLLVAETVQSGIRKRALNSGFGVLADYIFAESRGGEEIAMTAPVLAEPAAAEWRVRFVMPARYSRATLPAPGPGVSIQDLPARQVAAVRFAGRADDGLLYRQEEALRAWLAQRGVTPAGGAEHAFYNSPMIPGPLRRNEVLIPIENQIG